MQGVPLLSSGFHLSCVVGTCDTNLSAKGFHFTKNSVISFSSVDVFNVKGRFSWLDISVLRLDFMNKVPVCSFSDAKIRHLFGGLADNGRYWQIVSFIVIYCHLVIVYQASNII